MEFTFMVRRGRNSLGYLTIKQYAYREIAIPLGILLWNLAWRCSWYDNNDK